MAVPYTFASATSPIPLSQLDSNFGTTITLGNTAIQLGNTVAQLNNMTFANVTISSVATAITPVQGGTGLTAVGTSGNVLTSNGTAWLSQAPAAATGNVTYGNTTVALGGTSSSIGNLTLTNTTISSVASAFPNNFLANSTATLGNTTVTLGSTTTSVGNLTLANVTVTNYTETLYTSNTGTAITVSLTNGTVQKLTMNASPTITMPTAVAGKSFVVMLKQDGTGSYTPTWSTVVWPGNTTPTVTSTANKQDIYSFFSDGTSWFGATIGQNY